MSQTTTNIGRLAVADPDLGYDTLDGGTNLHAQLRGNFTAFSDHLIARYKSTTLANGANTTITHNFGLNLVRLKVLIWESGVLRTDAQVAADYTIAESGGSSTSAIVITNASGGSKTFVAVVLGMKLGINSGDFDPACSIDTTGNIRAAELRTTGNDLVLNHDAAGAGADWTGTLRRPSSGMSAAAIYTLPPATSTLATLALAETLAAKTLTSCAGITLSASAAIDWAAGSVAIGASIGANTMTLGGATSTVRAPGTVSAGAFVTDSDDLVLNTDAAGSGADWTGTIRRPSSGMTAAAVWTMPASTGTLATLARSEVFTNKDIDGGTASDTSRLTLPKETLSNFTGLTRKEGTVAYVSDEDRPYGDDGTNIFPLVGGKATNTYAAPYAAVAGTSIPITAGLWDETKYVNGSGGVDMTANPRVAAGTKTGQRLTLVGTSDTDYVRIQDGNGMDLNGDMILTDKSRIELEWDGDATLWRERNRRGG